MIHRYSLALLALALLILPGQAQDKKEKKKPEAGLNSATFSGLKMRGIGPALMSGRIADIAIHPKDQSTWYVAVGSGNVWKTTNAGTTWKPIFEKHGSYSIGCVTIDPNNHDVIWLGTGENVGGRHVGYGDGIYRSLDGGKSWKNMGLKESEHIGNIVVDPRDSNVVYVAVQGPLWSGGGERGLYKTTDGGKTWNKILGEGEYVGVNEVHMDPRNADVLYAATHERYRSVAALINGGPGSGIHKSEDGGATWRELKKGIPGAEKGKIGLAISPIKPDVIYATIELAHRKGGFYRSTNGGESWEKRNDYISGGTGPHYYQEIFASPHAFDRIYQMDARMRWTEDGGKTFKPMNERYKHGDSHAMAFDPNDPNYLLNGSDGGLYESFDLGATWKFVANLPVTQFYKVAVDYDEPFYNVYGGTQDNNTQGGPSRTDNNVGIRNSDWFITLFADGHQPAVDPTNPDIVYSEWQEGNLVRYDRKTGEIVYITPQGAPGDPAPRFNWDSPILISPHDHKRLYYANQRVWRSDDRGDSWRAISGDLTRNEDRLLMPMKGRVQSYDAIWDLWAMSQFSTITSLSESPLEDGLFYVGTDDGKISITEDGGGNWRTIDVTDLPDVPAMSFVNDIKADLHDKDTVYVVLDNHKGGDFKPYVLKSTNRGKKWTSIASDLPDRHIVWRLVQDHVRPELLFVGTEFGVFFTIDAGKKWVKFTGGVPHIPFRDLVIQTRENDLVGATFGRGFYILDDYTPLRHITEDNLKEEAVLFPVKDAWWYLQQRPLGRGEKATQGYSFYTAPNPPHGAVFTVYMSKGLQTAKQKRTKAEKKLIKEGKDTPYPGWDALREEDLEDKPAVVLIIKDENGDVIRYLNAPARKGFQRVTWDMRYPHVQAWRPGRGGRGGGNPFGPQGWMAAPGAYTATLALREDGVLRQVGEPQKFNLKPLHDSGTLKQMSQTEMTAALKKMSEASRSMSATQSVVREVNQKLDAVKATLSRSISKDAGALYEETLALKKRLYMLEEKLGGNRQKSGLGEADVPSISARMQVAGMGNRNSTYGPTANHMVSFDIAVADLKKVKAELEDMINGDLAALLKKLDEAGLPWTPGRSIPDPD